MKLETKEQVMYAMLKGIELEPGYEKWFISAMKEMFTDTEKQQYWMNELNKSLQIAQARADDLYSESN